MGEIDIRDPLRDQWPVELRSLNDQQRKFCLSYMEHKNAAKAARDAGYCGPNATAEDYGRAGYRVVHFNTSVRNALVAMTKNMMEALGPKAQLAMEEILNDRLHKDRAKIALALGERVAPTVQKHEHAHTHKFDPANFAASEFQRLTDQGADKAAIMLALNLTTDFEYDYVADMVAKQAKVIDGEVVDQSVDDDDELLQQSMTDGPE